MSVQGMSLLIRFTSLGILMLAVFVFSLVLGSVHIPLSEILSILWSHESSKAVWQQIILDFRLPRALTALLAGSALALSGLQMQTLFRNPLAGPFVLGISSGASLGVALLVLAGQLVHDSGFLAQYEEFGSVLAAVTGASLSFTLIVVIALRLKDDFALLLLGIMLSAATGGLISILMYFSDAESLQAFVLWGFGSFSGVTWAQLQYLTLAVLAGSILACFSMKSLNAFLLGESYAQSMGVDTNKVRWFVLLSTSLLAGSVTAFCGPIGFLGIAVPHLCRNLFHSSNHKILVPASILLGGTLALLSGIIAQLPGSQYTLPLNAVTALFGAPIVIWIILNQRIIRG